jgi:hypothetical protein
LESETTWFRIRSMENPVRIFWLNKLNQFDGNFVNAEIQAVLNSTEYRRTSVCRLCQKSYFIVGGLTGPPIALAIVPLPTAVSSIRQLLSETLVFASAESGYLHTKRGRDALYVMVIPR